MKKIFNVLLITIMVLCLTACGNDNSNSNKSSSNNTSQKEEKKEEQKENESVIIDDEIIDFDDEDNTPPEGKVTVEKVINCDNCVFAYFTGENEKAKKIGDTLTSDEYTKDINTLRTMGGKQRHNFFGLVLDGNKITRAYACILKDNKIYCIEGSVNGAYHNSNIAVLNQIFNSGKCKTISDGHTYTCTDGSYNGDTKTNGYTSLHYETSCTIYGADARTGQLTCH